MTEPSPLFDPKWISDDVFVERYRQAIETSDLAGRDWPRITVVTPAYKSADYIRDTIESVRLQFYPNLEYIVCDSVSEDGTQEILDEYPFLEAVVEKDKGQSDALNRAFARATGDILTWLNADDLFAPWALFRMALAFTRTKADIIAGQVVLFSEDTAIVRHTYGLPEGPLVESEILDLKGMWNTGQYFYQPEVFFTADIYRRAGNMVREDLHYSMDYDLWLRMAGANARISAIGAPIVYFRKHDAQKTHDTTAFNAELATLVDAHEPRTTTPPRYTSLIWSNRRPRIAMITDVGLQYGAGIGHRRIARAFGYQAADVRAFALCEDVGLQNYDKRHDHGELVRRLEEFRPDAVLVGNLHGAEKQHDWLHDVLARFLTYFVSHDFYWLTGRCAYFDGCDKFRDVSCDTTCPTFFEYPYLEPSRISAAAHQKASLLAHPNARIMANSHYAAEVFRQAFLARGFDADTIARKVSVAPLGVETDMFRPDAVLGTARHDLRARLNLPDDRAIVLLPSGDYSDARKNGALAWRLFSRLSPDRFHGLVVGNADIPPTFLDRNLSHAPYTKDESTLADLFSLADFVISTSRDETFGQTVVEGALSGAVPVSLGRGALPEVVGRIGNAFQSDPDQPVDDALAAAVAFMDDLVRSPTRLAGAKLTAFLTAQNAYSIEALSRTLHVMLKDEGVIARNQLFPKVDLQLAHTAPREIRMPEREEYLFTIEAALGRIADLEAETEKTRHDAVEATQRKQLYKDLALGIIEEFRHVAPDLQACYERVKAPLYRENLTPEETRDLLRAVGDARKRLNT